MKSLSRGLSLVEVLVGVAIIAVLASIALPALARVRSTSRAAVCLSKLQALTHMTELYLGSSADTYAFASPGTPLPVGADAPEMSVTMRLPRVWDLRVNWPSLYASITPWRDAYASWVCANSPRVRGREWEASSPEWIGRPSFFYSSTFFARPGVWNGDPSPPNEDLISAVRPDMVFVPAGKVMFVDIERAHDVSAPNPERYLVLFADGHADAKQRTLATPAGVNRFTGTQLRYFDTPNGVAGFDYR